MSVLDDFGERSKKNLGTYFGTLGAERRISQSRAGFGLSYKAPTQVPIKNLDFIAERLKRCRE